MRKGLFCLVFGYVLSQFYRAFLPVMSPYLAAQIGTRSEDLARASGLWFVAFALSQLPIGWALDRLGPRLTASLPLGVLGGGGALVFAAAQGPGAITLAMVLIGAGCAPVLVAAYYIYAREFPPAMFGTLAGATLGFGSFGNIAGTLPLAWSVAAFGWRASVVGVALITLGTAVALYHFVHDPARLPHDTPKGRMRDILGSRSFWLIAPMMIAGYAPAADIRSLWIGPHLHDVYGLSATGIGRVSLLMGLAMIAGSFAYGPLDRLIGSRKWGVFGGNLLALLCLVALALTPASGLWPSAMLFAALGFCGASYPAVMSHGRSFFAPHLMGRGVTLLTLVGIGGTGLMQVVTGQIHAAVAAAPPEAPYAAIYAFFACFLALALAIYCFSPDHEG